MSPDRYAVGRAMLDQVNAAAGEQMVASLADIAPDLARQIIEHGYGDSYARPALEPQQRQLITLGMLTALGGAESQLHAHIEGALNVGLAPRQIVEVFLHASVYCGYPRALNAVAVARQVFEERDLLPVTDASDASETT